MKSFSHRERVDLVLSKEKGKAASMDWYSWVSGRTSGQVDGGRLRRDKLAARLLRKVERGNEVSA